MELILLLIIAFIVGATVGFRAAQQFYIEGFRRIISELGVSTQDLLRAARRTAGPQALAELDEIEPTEDIVEVKLEQHQGQIYAFRKDNDQFLGQGADTDSLIQRLNETMKPCRVNVAKEDGADLLLKNNA
jgi:hypothetical protein